MVQTPWFLRFYGSENAPVRLFAFPFSGGSAFSYAPWREWLEADIECFGVQLPGRGMRLGEPLVSDIGALVDFMLPHLVPLLDRPYALFGHSNGALIAFSVMDRLIGAKVRPAEAIILSAKAFPAAGRPRESVSQLPDDAFLAKLKSLGGTAPNLLEHPEFKLFVPAIRADIALGENYVLPPSRPGTSDVAALLVAGQDDEIAPEEVFAWKKIFGRAQCTTLRGGHFYIDTNPNFPQLLKHFCRGVGGPLGRSFGGV